MEIIAQINTGGFKHTTTTANEIITRLDKLNVTKIIIGWSLDKDLYKGVVTYCVQRKIESYLWLPIFSEIGSIKNGFPIKGESGKDVESYNLSDDEDFTFYCANQSINTSNVYQLYEEEFSDIPFTGIFIDKIRYPSFANGNDGVISCFCDECKKKFNFEEDYDTSDLLSSIVSYKNNRYQVNNPKWESFFHFKAKTIYENLVPICSYFRKKGLKIGMDVYAPFMSYFVGQDIPLLSTLADFVKPMMYFNTYAPAGIPFELECMLSELNNDGSKFKELIGYESSNFLSNEIKNLAAQCKCEIFVGIEVNRTEPIALIYPEHIKENLRRYKDSNIQGFVLSWNILNAPEKNLEAISLL